MTALAVSSADIASYVTAAATLVLAFATFAAVRSGNRSARIAETALQEQRRPLLAPSRLEDPTQKIMFMEGTWVRASGGHAAVEQIDGTVYLAISLRNVGSGIGVCQGWTASPGFKAGRENLSPPRLDQFHLQSRDLYIPVGDIGMWQGALRHPDDQLRRLIVEAVDNGQPITVDLLYSDLVGLQRTISRFGLFPAGDTYLASMSRHWFLDWEGPRPESLSLVAAEAIFRDRQAVEESRGGVEIEDDAVGTNSAHPADRAHTPDSVHTVDTGESPGL